MAVNAGRWPLYVHICCSTESGSTVLKCNHDSFAEPLPIVCSSHHASRFLLLPLILFFGGNLVDSIAVGEAGVADFVTLV